MIQIIDYNAGNLQSVMNALKKLNEEYEIISSPSQIKNDSKLILAGVGAAGAAMRSLRAAGFDKIIPQLKNPFLGICLGMQLLLEFSEEGDTEGLGLIKGKVQKFPIGITVPQIGWNRIVVNSQPLLSGIPQNSFMYFVHSYYVNPQEDVGIANTEYEITFCSALKKDNFYGVQFHPEKSGELGLKILDNFIKLC